MIMHPHFKLSLLNHTPSVWRIISIPDTIFLTQLSHVINLCFGWPDTKIYEFEVAQPAARFTDNMRYNLSGIQDYHTLSNVTASDLLTERDSFVYHYGSLPSQKIKIMLDSFPRIQRQPTLQLIDAFGSNIPCQNGSCTPFHAQTVNWQLQGLNAKLVSAYEESKPSNIYELQRKLLREGLLDNLCGDLGDEFRIDELPDEVLDNVFDKIGDDIGRSLSSTYTLQNCLLSLNKEELNTIAHFHNLTGYSKLRKQELVKHIEAELQKPDIIENYFTKLTYPEIEQLDVLCNYNLPIVNSDSFINMQYLLAGGFCYVEESGFIFTLPLEIQDTFHQLLQSDSFQKAIYFNDLVHSFCFTAIYLYGTYPVAALLQKIETTLKVVLDPALFNQTLKNLSERRKEYVYRAGYIMASECANDSYMLSLQQLQKQKDDFFWPDEEDFEQLYWEKQLMNQMLYDSFQKEFERFFIGEDMDFPMALRQLEYGIRTGASFHSILEYLTEQQFSLPDKRTLKQFVTALQQIWSQTPMWPNCGYTPKQVVQKQQQNNNVVSLADYRKK